MDTDFLIIGSGFGGSVSALRLAEKGYKVRVLERGPRIGPDQLPKTNWNLKRWMWMPQLGCRGFFKMTFFRHLTALSGVGVGGGSLVYANTLPTPTDEFFRSEAWSALGDWKEELAPHYETARKMLGVTDNPMMEAPEKALEAVSRRRGQLDEFGPTEVGVFFGEPEVTVPDPFYEGKGPERTGCHGCGSCMIGCRHGAKNTLDKNYLYLAEGLGAEIEADTEVTWVRPLEGGGFEVAALEGRSFFRWRRKKKVFTARNVVFAGGVLGTVPLLLKLAESSGGLPELSPRLGRSVRTNSEALIGVVSERRDRDLSKGIAIGAILQTDEHSHIEVVRYPSGSGFFRLLQVPHVPGTRILARLWRVFLSYLLHPIKNLRAYLSPNWARYTTILLYMRTIESTLRLRLGRAWTTMFRRGLVTGVDEGQPPTASMPEATELAEQMGEELNGLPMSIANESLLNIPTTAHVLGGCCMGGSAEEGVVDTRHRVYGYEGLYVVDGSVVSANPGVNPSLTITAMAERAMSLLPEKRQG